MDSTLEEIKGITIKKLDIELEKGGDFIYYEGVLLAHYFNKNNPKEHYLYDWCDTDDIIHRWMVYKVEEKDLLDFLNKKISSLELIQKNQFCYFIDIDKNIKQKQILICAIEDIPKSYLPKETAYFDEELYEDYAKELATKLKEKYNRYKIITFEDKIKQLEENDILDLKKIILTISQLPNEKDKEEFLFSISSILNIDIIKKT